MPKLPGINHKAAVAAGFVVARQGSHIVMKRERDQRILTIPRHDPVNAFTMGGIIRDAGLSIDEFKNLLS
jgi:predicted RNA binding protein YcfA (HicA-like mRNA interferase family)